MHWCVAVALKVTCSLNDSMGDCHIAEGGERGSSLHRESVMALMNSP